MKEKKYRIKTACPQCGCSAVSHLSAKEMKEKYGDVPNIEIECNECKKIYEAKMREACPEWSDDCRSELE